MLREFEILGKAAGPSVAVKRGFCWPGFFFQWLWAFSRGLWVEGGFLLAGSCAMGSLPFTGFAGDPIVYVSLALILGAIAGLRGNSWRIRNLEQKGYGFVGIVAARSAAAAVAAHSLGAVKASIGGRKTASFVSLPGWLQRLLAIAWLTWKAAFRFRLFLVIAVLLLASVVGLPILIKDDGTARGFTQILLTYTLSVITVLLGLSTLWLSCGTLARDIEECQMQLIAVKPVARWQIWLGKWLGILSLNAVLLALSGASVYALLQWRATKLPAAEQQTLRNEVLVARGSLKEQSYNSVIEAETDRQLQERLKRSHVEATDLGEVRRQIEEQVKAEYQVVPPGMARIWEINLGLKRDSLRGQPLQLRIKFNAAAKSPSGTFAALWQVGVPKKTRLWSETMSLAPDTYHEFEIPPDLFDNTGLLTIAFINPNNTSLLFPLEDGMEVLYREGGFGLNFARGLGIIFCWMALLAALGLTSASFLSFPVAAFFSLGILTMALSSGTLAGVVSAGTITGYNSETGTSGHSIVDLLVIPAFRAALSVINLAKDFSPIDSLSSGRSISWDELGLAFGQIVVLLGGIIGVIGILIFNRRELATAQGNQ